MNYKFLYQPFLYQPSRGPPAIPHIKGELKRHGGSSNKENLRSELRLVSSSLCFKVFRCCSHVIYAIQTCNIFVLIGKCCKRPPFRMSNLLLWFIVINTIQHLENTPYQLRVLSLRSIYI